MKYSSSAVLVESLTYLRGAHQTQKRCSRCAELYNNASNDASKVYKNLASGSAQ